MSANMAFSHTKCSFVTLGRKCFICDHDKGECLFEQKFSLEDGHPLPDHYSVVMCGKCGNIYADVAATQNDYDIFYNGFSKYENSSISSGSALSEWDAQRIKKTVEKILSKAAHGKSTSIIDIGSAQGGMLEFFRKEGYHNLSALEPSVKCAKIIADRSENGVEIFSGSICSDSNRSLNNKKFDMVILSHVLEHIFDIKQTIENIKMILSPDGVVYIEVPDAERYEEFFKTPFHFFDMEHINHFTMPSLISLFSLNGFRAIDFGAKVIEASDSELYPAIYGFFSLNTADISIKNYIKMSEGVRNTINFDDYKKSQTPVVIWGVGSYTKQLLASTSLRECNIQCFIDSDVKKIGSSLLGFDVKAPECLFDFSGDILVISAIYAHEIQNQIKGMNIKNNVYVIK